VYEGYGPGGVGIIVECLTDNKNRSVAQVRHVFAKSGYALATSGSVLYQFQRQGEVSFENASEESLVALLSKPGVIDVQFGGDKGTLVTTVDALTRVASAVKERQATGSEKLSIVMTRSVYKPTNYVFLGETDEKKAQHLITELEAWRTPYVSTTTTRELSWRPQGTIGGDLPPRLS
jgi:transcriptional/translational regulatory protein YebC/TACO1